MTKIQKTEKFIKRPWKTKSRQVEKARRKGGLFLFPRRRRRAHLYTTSWYVRLTRCRVFLGNVKLRVFLKNPTCRICWCELEIFPISRIPNFGGFFSRRMLASKVREVSHVQNPGWVKRDQRRVAISLRGCSLNSPWRCFLESAGRQILLASHFADCLFFLVVESDRNRSHAHHSFSSTLSFLYTFVHIE